MHLKPILHLKLNYAHQNLSPSFRITAGAGGLLLCSLTFIGFAISPCKNMWVSLSFIMNLFMGIILIVAASKFLPAIAQKYIVINQNQFKYKLIEFMPRKSFNWDLVEQIEFSKTAMRVRLENETKVRFIPLHAVSYSDFELLQKSIIDICQERDIDLI